MIGHILKQDQNSDCNIVMTWAPEGKRRRARPKTTWRQTIEKESAEAGWRLWKEEWRPLRLTEISGGTLWRPYVPRGTKSIGEVRYKVSAQRFVGSFGWTSFSYDWSMVLKATKWSLRRKLVPIPLKVSAVANALNAQVYINEVRARFTGLALIHPEKKLAHQ